jgi:hypothetical protein
LGTDIRASHAPDWRVLQEKILEILTNPNSLYEFIYGYPFPCLAGLPSMSPSLTKEKHQPATHSSELLPNNNKKL